MIILYSKFQKNKTEFPVDRCVLNGKITEYQAGEQRTQSILDFYQVRMNSVGAANRRLSANELDLNLKLKEIKKIVDGKSLFIRKKLKEILKTKKPTVQEVAADMAKNAKEKA